MEMEEQDTQSAMCTAYTKVVRRFLKYANNYFIYEIHNVRCLYAVQG